MSVNKKKIELTFIIFYFAEKVMTVTVPFRYPVSSTTASTFKSNINDNSEPLLGRVDNVLVTIKNRGLIEYEAKYPFLTTYDPETKRCQKDLTFKNW